MKSLYIKGTAKTPIVNFDSTSGVFEIKGNSIPENSKDFFRPIIDWVVEYVSEPSQSPTINIMLEYFNTTSSKYLFEMLKKFEDSKKDTTVNWYFEMDDEDHLTAGQEYESLVKLKFNFIEQKLNSEQEPLYLFD